MRPKIIRSIADDAHQNPEMPESQATSPDRQNPGSTRKHTLSELIFNRNATLPASQNLPSCRAI